MLDQLSNGQRYMLNSLAHSNYPAASTVVFYDYIINISREIEYIWKRPFSVVTVLFGINRFALLVWAVANMPLYSYHKSALYWASVFTISVVQEAFTALRIYALVRKQLVLPISMLILSLTSILIPSYYMTSMTLSPAQYDIFGSITVAGAATSGLVDLFVVVLTWYRTHTLNRLGCASRNPLADVLLGSGALYFFAFLVCDVTTLWDMFGMTAYIENIYIFDLVFSFQMPLTSLTMSHFLLALREVASTTQGDGPATEQISTDLVFNHASHHTRQSRLASFVEPMGASLRYGQDNDDEDEEWDGEPSARTGAEEGVA